MVWRGWQIGAAAAGEVGRKNAACRSGVKVVEKEGGEKVADV